MVAPSLPFMQMLAQLGSANPALLAQAAATKGLVPPTAPMPVPEPGAAGAGALPTAMPGQPAQPALGPSPVPSMGDPTAQLGALMTGLGPASQTPAMQNSRAPSAPGASLPGGGRFDPQALAIMQAMMQGQAQPEQMSLGRLIAGG